MLVALALLAAFPAVSINTVPYSVSQDGTLSMDIYSTDQEEPAPIVMVIHGGAWVSGNRTDMRELCFAIARSGMVAATIDYRLAPEYKWPAMLEDTQAALAFIKSNASQFGADPNRIAVAGASAGGHLALLLGTMDETAVDIDAVLNLFGPVDLTKDFQFLLMTMMADQLIGKSLVDAEKEIKKMSPINYVSANDPPVFTIHGTDDPLVPYKQAERLAEAHANHTLITVDGMEHGIDIGHIEEVRAVLLGIDFLFKELSD